MNRALTILLIGVFHLKSLLKTNDVAPDPWRNPLNKVTGPEKAGLMSS
jgi:hypothetical protein